MLIIAVNPVCTALNFKHSDNIFMEPINAWGGLSSQATTLREHLM